MAAEIELSYRANIARQTSLLLDPRDKLGIF
jgi:hypothetical protein